LGKDNVHPNLLSAEIDDTIKLLNIELDRRHLHVDLALIPMIENNSLYALILIVVNSGRPHDRINWGGAVKTNHRIY